MSTTALLAFDGNVKPEWIDYNGHMNEAYYVLAFSSAIDLFMDTIGIDQDFRAAHQVSIYTLENMIRYLKEVHLSDHIRIELQVLEHDSKKIRVFSTMYQGVTDTQVATMESLLLHMDMTQHKASAFLPATKEKLDQLAKLHEKLPTPLYSGRVFLSRQESH